MKIRSLVNAMLVSTAIFSSISASAVTTTYSNESSWASTVTETGGDNYNSWSGISANYMGSSATLSGINYANSNGGAIYQVGTALTYDAPYLTSGYLEWQSGNTLTITLPFAVTALSFNYGQFYGNAGNEFDITLSNGFSSSVFTADNAYAFFGVVSDTGFSSLTIDSAPFPIIDNFAFGNSGNSVPEPASIALLGIALAGLSAARRRKEV